MKNIKILLFFTIISSAINAAETSHHRIIPNSINESSFSKDFYDFIERTKPSTKTLDNFFGWMRSSTEKNHISDFEKKFLNWINSEIPKNITEASKNIPNESHIPTESFYTKNKNAINGIFILSSIFFYVAIHVYLGKRAEQKKNSSI